MIGLDIGCQPHAENLDLRHRAVGTGRFRQPVFKQMVETVDLITENAGCRAKDVAIAEARPVKGPVRRAVDGEAARAVADAVAEP